jgi:hypothetical protein
MTHVLQSELSADQAERWAATIVRDEATQAHMQEQAPHSGAYMAGAPPSVSSGLF